MQQGGTLADTSTITLTAAPPVLQAVILTPSSASLNTGATQQFSVSGQWSNGATTAPAVTYSATGGTHHVRRALHRREHGRHLPGHRHPAGRHAGGYQRGDADLDGRGAGTTLLTEGFEDANISSRGWFDATSISIATDARPGSSGSQGTAVALDERHDGAAGLLAGGFRAQQFGVPLVLGEAEHQLDRLEPVNYHPHMFHFLTTADDRYIGPSISHLTLYDELLYVPGQGGIAPVLSMQDALMIDPTKLMVDLTNVTEQRAIGGYNGRPEPGLTWDAFDYGGGLYTNYKLFQPARLS